MPPSGPHHVARREGFMTTPNGRVMFIAAHPDDPDFLAGGTVARLAKEGREVAYVILTNGNKGSSNRSVTSEQLAPIRAEEQRRAAQVLAEAREVPAWVRANEPPLNALNSSHRSSRGPPHRGARVRLGLRTWGARSSSLDTFGQASAS